MPFNYSKLDPDTRRTYYRAGWILLAVCVLVVLVAFVVR
jgi:hypothetical protein